jgi:hypothetical protein
VSAVCNSKDDPVPLDRWAESAGREVISSEIITPVSSDPGLDAQVAWAASYTKVDELELEWWAFRTGQERKHRSTLPGLWFELRHLDDGTLEIYMSPAVGRFYTPHYAFASVALREGELVATLRSYSGSDTGRLPRQRPIVGGELRLSSTSWSVGTELSVFLEITEFRYRHICGEARFVVPPRGGETDAY